MEAEVKRKVTAEELRVAPAFADLPAEDLGWLADHGRTLELERDEKFVEDGTPADEMIIIVEGSVQFVINIGGAPVPAGLMRKGTVTGVLPYSRMRAHGGDAIALERSRALLIHRDHFPEMLQRIPQIGERLVAIMADRVRDATKSQQQREKMMALGKLSAGLAHELNNPAAATRRATCDLRERFERIPSLAMRVVGHGLKLEEIAKAEEIREVVEQRPAAELSALERSEKEEEVIAWLEDHGIEDGHLFSDTFVHQGMTPECLNDVAETVPAEALTDVLAWIENYMAAHTLLDEILSSTNRISELVRSVKSYTHMDRAADKQTVKVCEGIDNTLVMLGHKLRKQNIQVVRKYEPECPPIQALPGELNQVWTNLIDNAIDAMPKGGALKLSVEREHQCILVKVEDSGSGIPEDIQQRIFEPFFTTKGVGEGTGLGLDIVHRIVTIQHKGTIKVKSKPGETVFLVWLPVE